MAVVLAVQAVQVVHGALELQVPEVQPGQLEAGQALPPHQEVQAPEVHGPAEPHGPQPLPPKGEPSDGFQPPKPPNPPQLPEGTAVPHGPCEMLVRASNSGCEGPTLEMEYAEVKEAQSLLEGPFGCAEV